MCLPGYWLPIAGVRAITAVAAVVAGKGEDVCVEHFKVERVVDNAVNV